MSTGRANPKLNKAFGATVRELRTGMGVSQEDFALLAGLDRTYVGLIERGIRNPTIKTVWTLARHLKVRPSELIRRVEAQIRK